MTRIAPTPSGLLHEGNLLNFLLIDHFAQQTGAKVLLRIDDLDQVRCRDEYIENIFEELAWLGIKIHSGPSGLDDFKKNYSQNLKSPHYRCQLSLLETMGLCFRCSCSRKSILEDGSYSGKCRDRNLTVEEGPIVRINTETQSDLPPLVRDCVLWTRDDHASYQLSCVVNDHDDGVNFIIRGEDLLASTKIQRHLYELLYKMIPPHIYHHSLLTLDGKKMSKSTLKNNRGSCRTTYRSLKNLKDYIRFDDHRTILDRYLLEHSF